MRANYHTHSPRCKHALGDSIFEYVDSAYKNGIEILGLSDHAPFPDFDWYYRMQYAELPDYLADVDKIRADYAGRMTVYKGVEIEYMPQYLDFNQNDLHFDKSVLDAMDAKGFPRFTGGNYYEFLLEQCKLDYLLLGEHIYQDASGRTYNIYDLESDEEIRLYAMRCVEAMKTGYFKILAHPDLYCNAPLVWGKAHEEAADMIIDAAIQTGVVLEFNANGLRRGIQEFPDGDRYPYPDDRFWKKVAGTEARIVIGSDSHSPLEIVDWATDLAERKLKEFGITPIDEIF